MAAAQTAIGVTELADKPLIVKAVHAYTPVNNDELKLEKGDVITVTQNEEGGWWEGTLHGRTGWFPSTYVNVIEDLSPTSPPPSLEAQAQKTSSWGSSSSSGTGNPSSSRSIVPESPAKKGSSVPLEEQIKYRSMILSDLLESEETHVRGMREAFDNYLQHLSKSPALTPAETKILIGNLPEVIQCQVACLLMPIKTEKLKPWKEQRIGKVFLDNAPKLESTLKTYCENHPKAVQVIERHKETLDTFMEEKGAASPGLLALLNALSQPFLRIEKYPTALQELERHIEESHKGRGDLQRSIEYYKQLDKTCGAVRKQKEMELEVLSGAIAGWEGSDVAQLGEILHMSLVHMGQDSQPRYFVLFTNTLLILSYNSERNSLAYEGKIPVSGITLTPVTEKERNVSNAFEIAGPMLDPILVSCGSKQAKEAWVHHLSKILQTNRFPSGGPASLQSVGLSPPVQAWNVSRLRPTPPYNPFLNECLSLTPPVSSTTATTNGNGTHAKPNAAPVPSIKLDTANVAATTFSNYTNSTAQVTNEEDFAILSIVDAFCSKNRQTAVPGHGAGKTNAGAIGDNTAPPRTLADLVFNLRDEVSTLRSAMSQVSSQLEEEQKARKALQSLLQTNSMVSSTGSILSSTGTCSMAD